MSVSVPLMGLFHRCSIFEPSGFNSDGMGGYTALQSFTASNVECRFSRMVTKGDIGDVLKEYGYSTENAYRVIMKPRDIDTQSLLFVTGQLGVLGGMYRILNVKQQFNSTGVHHHTSIICELDDA
jgi:hypothetical protein